MITLQVQETNQETGKVEVLFDIETKEDSKEWMTNELHLMYEDRATETIHINVVQVHQA
tara:strand:+ start:180 stop:356 length:177 start_codon:yes stop_codon:yes gene_type:complete